MRPGSAHSSPRIVFALSVLWALAASAVPTQNRDQVQVQDQSPDRAREQPSEDASEEAVPPTPPGVAEGIDALATRPPSMPPVELLPVRAAGQLTTAVGTGRLLTLPTDIERIALADEALARVQVVSSREVLLSGLTVGRTTLFVWLRDGERRSYDVRVEYDLGIVRQALLDLGPDITLRVSEDGSSIFLVGEVDDAQTADRAVAVVRDLVMGQGNRGRSPEILSFLRFPPSTTTADLWLTEALQTIDRRIRVRRIQVGTGPQPEVDSYILEGRVRTVRDLTRAVILAERQLGGTGVQVEAPTRDLDFQRTQGFTGTGVGELQALTALNRPPSGLAAQVARGLVITSESGRVLSLLEVDDLPQIMVSIRAYQIDRAKARRLGIDWRFDSEHLSLGSFTRPGAQGLPGFFGGEPDVGQISGGDLVGAFVDQTFSLVTALDLLQEKELARAVAEPNILTLSGEEATILIGGEVPIPTTTVGEVAAVQGFFFQSFGVQLNLRPTLDDEGIVSLEVSPSIIRPSPGLGVGQVPGFQVQSVQTTARVPAGQSLVLGGLLTFDEGTEEARVPLLGKIPLFRWRRRSRSEQELLFIITPRIVRTPAPPTEAVETPRLEDLRLPAMKIPEDRDDWRDDVEAPVLPPSGVPEEFLRPPAAPPPTAEPVELEPGPRDTPAGEIPTASQTEAPAESETEDLLHDEPRGTVRVVAASARPCLSLRPQPSFLITPIGCLAPGTRVEILGHFQDWDRVSAPDGRVGWMLSRFLVPANDPPPRPEETFPWWS